MNEYRRQEPPFTVKIELTEGCNLRCGFCGIHGIRGKNHDFKHPTPEQVSDMCRQMARLGWTSRIELAMHGEPTMHPRVVECVAVMREALPKTHIMMTSNGGGLLGKRDKVLALFDAGLNVLALDDYRDIGIVAKIRTMLEADPLPGVDVFTCPDQPEGNPYRRHKSTYKMISYMRDLRDTAGNGNGIRSHLNNGCGAAGQRNNRLAGKRCARPFRELAIRWDGSAALCCNDWRGEYFCGNVLSDGVEAVWQSAAMHAARRKLYHGERNFGPCDGCDSVSFRAGLLPDPVGRGDLPSANDEDEEVIRVVLEREPLTKPFKREWEQ